MKGTCLCGAVRYEVMGTPTAFDLCHCSRCRESSGSAFIAELVFEAAQFEWISGASVVKTYEAPVRMKPPGCMVRHHRWAAALRDKVTDQQGGEASCRNRPGSNVIMVGVR